MCGEKINKEGEETFELENRMKNDHSSVKTANKAALLENLRTTIPKGKVC